METQILTPVTYDLVRNAPKPELTKSYFPISHGELIDFVREKVDKMGLKIDNERYSTNKDQSKMFAEMAISCEDSDLRYALGFRNSHDKSLPVGFVSGAQVIVCSNLMLAGDVKQVRRHTSRISEDLDEKFELIEKNIEKNFKTIKEDIQVYKEKDLSYNKAAELYGKLLIKDTGIATVQQVTKAIDLFKAPIHGFGNDTAWGFVNTMTEVFKESHPKHATRQYLDLREFVNREFNISKN
jgi:hypothetical protein